jgi:hypothetical protein
MSKNTNEKKMLNNLKTKINISSRSNHKSKYKFTDKDQIMINPQININTFPIIDIDNDGNCWYRAIYGLLTGITNSNDNGFKVLRVLHRPKRKMRQIAKQSLITHEVS